MPYFTDLNTYLHQSSLLIQAYPTTRITTKYSLPRKANPKNKSQHAKDNSKPSTHHQDANHTSTQTQKRDPSATLTLKTFHPESGICLKYKTDKAAEVGRLIQALGRLAKGEEISLPTGKSGVAVDSNSAEVDKMDIDGGSVPLANTLKVEDKVVTAPPVSSQTTSNTGGGGKGGGGKKKKGKK